MLDNEIHDPQPPWSREPLDDDEDPEPGLLPDTDDTYAWVGIAILATTALLVGALLGGLFAVWLYTR